MVYELYMKTLITFSHFSCHTGKLHFPTRIFDSQQISAQQKNTFGEELLQFNGLLRITSHMIS